MTSARRCTARSQPAKGYLRRGRGRCTIGGIAEACNGVDGGAVDAEVAEQEETVEDTQGDEAKALVVDAKDDVKKLRGPADGVRGKELCGNAVPCEPLEGHEAVVLPQGVEDAAGLILFRSVRSRSTPPKAPR